MGFDTNFTLKKKKQKALKKEGGGCCFLILSALYCCISFRLASEKKSIVYLPVIAILSPCCHVLKQISCIWLFDIKYKIFF